MTCRTHIACANALAIGIIEPDSIASLGVCMTAATIGGAVCDLDIVTSDSHKYVDRFVFFISLIILIALGLEMYFDIGIFSWIDKNSSYFSAGIGSLMFLGVCFYGMHKPHRSFLHSFLGLTILTLCAYIAFEKFALAFFIGMLSHILLDLFNKKGVQLFFPIKKRYDFRLCHSDGIVNSILFVGGLIIIAVELFTLGTL